MNSLIDLIVTKGKDISIGKAVDKMYRPANTTGTTTVVTTTSTTTDVTTTETV